MLDTNFISYFIGGKIEALDFVQKYANEIKIPDIAYYEVLRGLYSKNSKNNLNKFEAFAEHFGILSMSKNTMKIAASIYAELKQKGLLIEDDDILIGALAVEYDATLLTSNEKHLSRIANLKVLNLFN